MRSSAIRVARQQMLFGARRNASTSSPVDAAKVKEQATAMAGKATKVAGEAAAKFANLAASTGGRTGAVLKKIQAAIPPTVYYSKVGIELAKLVFRGQKMTPPDMATFQSTLKSFAQPSTMSAFYKQAVESIRTCNKADAAFVGVLAAEILGFFTVGEMIGRRKIVGYRGETAHHH
ncbi:putative mitochondrial F1F0-ATP synthase g subunit [Pyronema domesticum]|uniref:Similar to ATP synthase subunit g, mitochondrial acc. no. Q12233 n=1 Tax=Pyronema omphalodes (strain CBS 100304) TaxID=1076935 RepID=U4KX24_PYROM|nr:putative mitochondrial F1F0-ATP synthase g subunit [Pyronema domesticum]CCX06517.1 Similar to ATP synthase subunit g, mitochondrial; acc. no. Q12233 [Pyronema omphalodes CBS 100304]